MKLKSFLLVILVVLCLIPAAACNDAPAGPLNPKKNRRLIFFRKKSETAAAFSAQLLSDISPTKKQMKMLCPF